MCIVTSDPVSRASAGQRERSSRLRVSEIESSRELHVVTRGNQICLRVAHCVMPGPVGIPTLDRVAWPKFGPDLDCSGRRNAYFRGFLRSQLLLVMP